MDDDWAFPSEMGMVLVLAVYWLALLLVRGLTFGTLSVLLPEHLVAVGKEELYGFLSDPQTLKLIHSHTTDVIVEEKKVETDGTSSLTFVWVETLPTTVRSRTRMTRDPNTGTITLDVTPILPCLAVKVTWRIRDADESDVTVTGDVESLAPPTRAQPTAACPPKSQHSRQQSAAERGKTEDSEDGSDAVTRMCDSTKGRHSCFTNCLLLRGPRLLLHPIGGMIRRAQLDLMEAVQKRYTKNLNDGEL